MIKKLFFIFVLCLLTVLCKPALADVGVGLSPSKIILQIEGGTKQDFQFLAFNSGDYPLDISLSVSGDIVKFTKIGDSNIMVEPEPKPHALPIKNGRTFTVTFSPPVSSETKRYTGTVSASGSPSKGAQFGGSVGVAAPVEIIVTPPASMLAFITPTYSAIILLIIAILAIIFLLKKSGITISVQRRR